MRKRFANEMHTPLSGLRLPDGTVTSGHRPERTLRLRNARMAKALDLSGKRVLDIGCAEGLHSLYMAESASEVIGIDHRKSAISRANAAQSKLGITNAQFMVGDVRDNDFFSTLGHFDLVVAWGLLHRISDPFQFFWLASRLSDALSIEFRTPVIPFMDKLSISYHSIDADMDLMNIERDGVPESAKRENSTGFWECTPGAVCSMAKKFGYKRFQTIGYRDNFRSGFTDGSVLCLKHVAKLILRTKGRTQLPLTRVHMLLQKKDGCITFAPPMSKEINLPSWDTSVRSLMKIKS